MLQPQFKTQTKSQDGQTGIFVMEPLEKGFGNTLGNALRRCLLSSIKGRALTAVKVDGVKHQFSTLSGLKEDIIELILNLKQVVIKSDSDEPITLKISTQGPKTVTAKDIKAPANVTIVNPELEIARLSNAKSKLECELFSDIGYGYSLAEERKTSTVGIIPMDAAYNPIRQVNYQIEAARVGRRTDFDRLILEIKTNGSIDPLEALESAAKVLVAHFQQIYQPVIVEEEKVELPPTEENANVLNLTVEELDLPTRIANALRRGGYKTVRDLSTSVYEEVAKVKNLGGKSIDIIKEKLVAKGVELFKE
jgi:DNA-directed RNA polymerase subunit alpha